MVYWTRIPFLVYYIMVFDHVASQITEGFLYPVEKKDFFKQYASVFKIIDNEKLFLNETYCLKSILVRVYLSNDTFNGECTPSMRLDIAWESDHNMTSLNVKSNSQNDSYCDSEDKFSYHRKPIKPNIHTFPDLVNYGSRYIPIKLDCKYIITPELTYPCEPVNLEYSTPVCLQENICSCRNASLPAPELTYEIRETGVVVLWQAPEYEAKKSLTDIKKICITLELSKESLAVDAEDTLPREYSSETWENKAKKSGKHFFALNSSLSRNYVVKGYYENLYECSGNVSRIVFHFAESRQEGNGIALYLISYTAALVVLISAFFFFLRRKFGRLLCNKLLLIEEERMNPGREEGNESVRPPPDFQHLISVMNPLYDSEFKDDLFAIDYRQLLFASKLGEGNFGIVHLATSSSAIRGYREFAVKQLKSSASREDVEDFLEEIKMHKKLGRHEHVVRMIGYCRAPLSLVMEYVPFNLLKYLKNLRDEFQAKKSRAVRESANRERRYSSESLPPNYILGSEVESVPLNANGTGDAENILDNRELESFALQIARGMEHVERRGVVHRDLAARNILIDNYKTLKISDFGMSRMGIYVNKSDRKFPLRWMSPEAVTERTFSNKSDVWSYGIVLWEIGTLGGIPYPDLQNSEVLSLLRKGGHPEQPESIMPSLYNLMVRSWAYLPCDRPSFAEIVRDIESLRQKTYVDFTDLQGHYDLPPTEEDVGDS